MELTDIVIRNMSNAGKLKAVVSCTFDNVFVVHDIKVISSSQGLFIAMPSRKTPNGNFIDIAHPIRTEFRNYLSELILAKYDEEQEDEEDYDFYDEEDEDDDDDYDEEDEDYDDEDDFYDEEEDLLEVSGDD